MRFHPARLLSTSGWRPPWPTGSMCRPASPCTTRSWCRCQTDTRGSPPRPTASHPCGRPARGCHSRRPTSRALCRGAPAPPAPRQPPRPAGHVPRWCPTPTVHRCASVPSTSGKSALRRPATSRWPPPLASAATHSVRVRSTGRPTATGCRLHAHPANDCPRRRWKSSRRLPQSVSALPDSGDRRVRGHTRCHRHPRLRACRPCERVPPLTSRPGGWPSAPSGRRTGGSASGATNHSPGCRRAHHR